MNATEKHPTSYDPVIQTVHWLTLCLIAAIYTAAWVAHSGLAGEAYLPVMQLHRSFGVSVFALTIFRLAWRRRAQIPALPEDLAPIQKLAARVNEALLYLLLLAQPVLGVLQTNARGQRVDLFFLGELPAVIGADRPFARQLHDLHALVANVLLALIGLHAGAALFHHLIRRDGVLDAMLPRRLRGFGRRAFALILPREQS
jgi:superoxide oxidase